MGQSQLPISPTSQQLQLSVAAVAATTPTSYSPTNVLAGSATFTFQSVPDHRRRFFSGVFSSNRRSDSYRSLGRSDSLWTDSTGGESATRRYRRGPQSR